LFDIRIGSLYKESSNNPFDGKRADNERFCRHAVGWTNEPSDAVAQTSGIFFSVWSSEESRKRNRLLYNIHALKMRELKGFSIQSRDFAADFRAEFAAVQGEWPHVSVAFGPQTLMQGWIDDQTPDFEGAITDLVRRFIALSPLIDGLLDRRRL